MSLLNINDVDFSDGTQFKVDLEELSKAQRVGTGLLVKDLIALKWKIFFQADFYDAEKVQRLFEIKTLNSFTVRFWSTKTMRVEQGIFYMSTLSATVSLVKNGVPELYKGVSFNLVEL